MKQTLIQGGLVVTMDAQLGDLSQGDVLIEGNSIAAVAPSISAPGAQVILPEE